MRVLVIAGGVSHEREVSLSSGARVLDALRAGGADARAVEPGPQLIEYLAEIDRVGGAGGASDAARWCPDVVWPLVHGATGEDGGLQDLLASSGLPFVGSAAEGARLAWDKSVAKTVVARHGLLSPDAMTISRELLRQLGAKGVIALVMKRLGESVVVKPTAGGSAQGVTVLPSQNAIADALLHAFSYCERVLIERHISGTELAVSILDLGFGPRALPPVEICTENSNYGYRERYTPGESTLFVPARLSPNNLERAQDAATLAHTALRLKQLSRIDLIIDSEGTPWFLEANVTPGMTETSLLPQAVLADGERLEETYIEICSAAIRGA